MGYLSKRKFEEREHYLVTGLLILIPVLTLLGTLGRSLDWRLDYLGEFKIQAACLSFALFVWCLIKREWIKTLIFFILVLLNLALVASHSYLFQKESALPEDSYVFTVLYQNLKGAENKANEIRGVMENTQADFVLWTNVPVEIYRQLDDLSGYYQLQNQTLDTTGKMKLIFARTPGVDRGITAGEDGLWVSRVIGTRKLTLLLTNFDNPWREKAYARTKQKIFELADFARGRDEPVILMGNFGASGWSWLCRSSRRSSPFKDLACAPRALKFPSTSVSIRSRRIFAVRRSSASIPKVMYFRLVRPLLPFWSWFFNISAYSLRIPSYSSPRAGISML